MYHKDLPKKWIDIIENDEVLKEIWEEHYFEYEAVPEFLFQSLRGEMYRIKPIFALYGELGLEMYEKLAEIEALTIDTARKITGNGETAYAGYFYVKAKGDEEVAKAAVREYIKAINDIYVKELEEEALMDENSQIEFPSAEKSEKIQEELEEAWCSYEPYMPEMDMSEAVGDWFRDLDIKAGCEELRYIFSEALYHISNDYYLSHYIQWSIMDVPDMENPFMPYYKLWCMGLEPRFVAKDKVIVL